MKAHLPCIAAGTATSRSRCRPPAASTAAFPSVARVARLRLMASPTRQRASARGWNKRHRALGLANRVFLRAVPARASLVVNPAGVNNGITWRAVYHGAAGNSIRVAHIVSGANTPLSVSVSGNDVTINVATSGASAATSTARQIIDAVAAHRAASQKIHGEATEGDGTGVVAAQAMTSLTGGSGT